MIGALTGIRMKAQRALGGVVSNILYEDIALRSVGMLISVDLNFLHADAPSKNPPVYRDITFRNITGWGDLAAFIRCLPESPCTNFTLESVFPPESSEGEGTSKRVECTHDDFSKWCWSIFVSTCRERIQTAAAGRESVPNSIEREIEAV